MVDVSALIGRETRLVPAELEARGEGSDGGLRVVGYAVTYGRRYDVWGGPAKGGFTEEMVGGSWKRTIAHKADIRFLENHMGIPYARTKSGTMTLVSDDIGVLVDAEFDPEQQRAKDFYAAIKRGDVDQMSVAFEVLDQKWEEEDTVRRILQVKGFDVSGVTYPANEETLVMARDTGPAGPGDPPARGMSLRMAFALAAEL